MQDELMDRFGDIPRSVETVSYTHLDVYKRQLSNKRAVAAMPVAGSYRSIDFALSNMTNSHIQNVAVFTQYNSRSLNLHLSSSKWWDFGRKQGGLFVFTPSITPENGDWYRGTADALYQNLTFLKNSHEPVSYTHLPGQIQCQGPSCP